MEDFERLYWTMLESPDAHVEVEYANDLSVVQYGSAFPTAAADVSFFCVAVLRVMLP